MSDDFLSRWSRRKAMARRVRQDNGHRSKAPGECASHPSPRGAAEADGPAAERALTPEEIARLPKIDELTAGTDITGFLRRGVPEALRNAVLRKMWTLDPAIRDFAGHARDYAYDWNTPGGVPGGGTLAPGDDVAAMARRIVGGWETESPGRSGEEKDHGHGVAESAAAVRSDAAIGRETARIEGDDAAIDEGPKTGPHGKGGADADG